MDPEDNTNSEANLYELAYILEPQVAEEKIPEEVNRVTSVIESAGGTVTLSDNPKLRGLAYTIERSTGGRRQKYNQGYFGWMKFTIEGSKTLEVSLELDRISAIIRKLVTHSSKSVQNISTHRMFRKTVPNAPLAEAKATEAEIDKEVEKLIESAGVAV